MWKCRFLGVLLLVGVVSGACRKAPPENTQGASPVSGPHATVWVATDGTIELNGQVADLAAVEKSFAELEAKKGAVVYGREMASAEPPPNGMEVIRMVIKHRLPIRMSTKRDFSDAVDDNGRVTQ